VALVLGTRPALAPADIVHHLRSHYGIPEERVTVRRTRPNDFLVRFADSDDLLRVLANQRPVGARFLLRWRRWSRLISGSAGAFRFRVLVGMKGIPAHAQSVEVAQAILGSAGAKVEFASPEALADPDDERELFAAAWCAHPDLVPDEVIMAVLEPEEPHDGGPNLFFLRPHEIIHDDVPALRYLVRIRLVEFQDWHTPPTSDDEDGFLGAGPDDDDSDDSNFNGFHPGEGGGGRGPRPRTTSFAGDSDPRLGRGSGPGFLARGTRASIGAFACPVASPRGSSPWTFSSGQVADKGTRVDQRFGPEDAEVTRCCSPHSVKTAANDPMVDEAALCTPLRAARDRASLPCNFLDDCPLRTQSASSHRGLVGGALVNDLDLFPGLSRPGVFFVNGLGPSGSRLDGARTAQAPLFSDAEAAETLFLSGPEEGGSGPSSPRPPNERGQKGTVVPSAYFCAQSDNGTEKTTPTEPDLHVATPEDGDAVGRASLPPDQFIQSFKKPLQTPVIQSTPRLRTTRHKQTDGAFPKRSARLAAKSGHREPKPEAQARKIMMKKLGVHVQTEAPDEASFDEFQTAFIEPVQQTTREAMDALFQVRKQRTLGPVSAD
jgi:hypothetical protein